MYCCEKMVKLREPHNEKNVPCETIDEPSDIDLAIKLLKESGYKIYKPVTNFEEI